jgi:hypothetical protein
VKKQFIKINYSLISQLSIVNCEILGVGSKDASLVLLFFIHYCHPSAPTLGSIFHRNQTKETPDRSPEIRWFILVGADSISALQPYK